MIPLTSNLFVIYVTQITATNFIEYLTPYILFYINSFSSNIKIFGAISLQKEVEKQFMKVKFVEKNCLIYNLSAHSNQFIRVCTTQLMMEYKTFLLSPFSSVSWLYSYLHSQWHRFSLSFTTFLKLKLTAQNFAIPCR